MKTSLIALLLLLGASAACADIYTWKDAKGTRHYTNSLHEIPARYLKRARILDVATGKVGKLATAQPLLPAQPAPQGAPAPSPLQPAQPTAPVQPSQPAQTPVAVPAPAPATPPSLGNPAQSGPVITNAAPQSSHPGRRRRGARSRVEEEQ